MKNKPKINDFNDSFIRKNNDYFLNSKTFIHISYDFLILCNILKETYYLILNTYLCPLTLNLIKINFFKRMRF